MHKLAGFIRLEKFVQIKKQILRYRHPQVLCPFHTVTNNVGHLMEVKGTVSAQIGIRIFNLPREASQSASFFLLVGICPVVGALSGNLSFARALNNVPRCSVHFRRI